MNPLQKLFSTNVSALLFRVTLGAVIFMHGAQKLFGWFGGQGFAATLQSFTEQMNLSSPIALLVILIESIGAICLILGLGSRVMAFGIMSIMVGAIVMIHWNYDFLMGGHNSKPGEGFEYHLLAIASSLGIMLEGGGQWSIDSILKFGAKQRMTHGRKELVGA
jgi:putative oxidoreductase